MHPYPLGPFRRLVVILERYFEMDCCSKSKKEIFKKDKTECGEIFHRWTDFIYSFNPVTVKEDMKWKLEISETFIQEISGAEFGRLNDGVILINESLDGWEIRKNLFVALDTLSHSLLLDIFRMESERYRNQKPDIEIDEPGERIRKLLYFSYIPELIRSHNESSIKHI